MKRYLLSLLVIPFILTGCAQISPTIPTSNPPISQVIESLDAFHWQLTHATNRKSERLNTFFIRPDKPVQLNFEVNRFTISNTCNNMMGQYSLNGNIVTFSHIASTRKLCADSQLNNLDQTIANQMQYKADIDLYMSANPVMKLYFINGITLTFTGYPNDNLQYGGTSEVFFIEVASTTVACNIRQKKCLKVRDVYYDDNGIITGTGTWRTFYPEIKGYKHKGKNQILRVKRHNKAVNTPANSTNNVYILDMIVQ